MAGTRGSTPSIVLGVLALLLGGASPARAQGAEGPEKIRDNLFLLEEAYNQEPGVIQHIQLFQYVPRARGWSYAFTEEWPAPTDRHQVSITVPVLRAEGSTAAGVSDLLLNYRLQAVGIGGTGRLAVAPRVSLALPTGDPRRGTGRGSLGVQVNLPVSIELGTRLVVHVNAGATLTPQAHSAEGRTALAVDANAGVALVFLPFTWVNLLVETAYLTTEVATDDGNRRVHAVIVNPGLRFAVNAARDFQIVPGLSAPITVWPRPVGAGVLAYLSLEHRLW